MDLVSTLVGFLVGTCTGAAGTYFADKYTDQRREKQRTRDASRLWKDIEKRFPAVIAEMREDFSPPDKQHYRCFFVKDSGSILGFVSEPSFEYHQDKHLNLHAAVAYLEQHGFISDITSGHTKRYRVHEKLVDALLS